MVPAGAEEMDRAGRPSRKLETAARAARPPVEGESDVWVRVPLPRPREVLEQGGTEHLGLEKWR